VILSFESFIFNKSFFLLLHQKRFLNFTFLHITLLLTPFLVQKQILSDSSYILVLVTVAPTALQRFQSQSLLGLLCEQPAHELFTQSTEFL